MNCLPWIVKIIIFPLHSVPPLLPILRKSRKFWFSFVNYKPPLQDLALVVNAVRFMRYSVTLRLLLNRCWEANLQFVGRLITFFCKSMGFWPIYTPCRVQSAVWYCSLEQSKHPKSGWYCYLSLSSELFKENLAVELVWLPQSRFSVTSRPNHEYEICLCTQWLEFIFFF